MLMQIDCQTQRHDRPQLPKKRPFFRRADRAARKQHDILIVRHRVTGDVTYVRCPVKIGTGRTRTVSVSKDRRWQVTGSQIFFQCA